MKYLLALPFALIGALLGEWFGFWFGLALGVLAAVVLSLQARVLQAERALDKVSGRIDALAALPLPTTGALPSRTPPVAEQEPGQAFNEVPVVSPNAALADQAATVAVDVRPPTTLVGEAPVDPVDSTAPAGVSTAAASVSAAPPTNAVAIHATGPPNALERALQIAKEFFTTGNVVAKVGVVVLFFGVAFLLKFAFDHAVFPPELRLSASALGGMALVGVGFRLRRRADAYGLLLQGAGIAITYLTVFAAARLYHLVPLPAALVIMVVVVASSCVLAVLQNSEPLAVLAMGGGFLAPILTSTGGGSQVALFSYYELLNLGILAVSALRVWRWLNWVGFLFTFVIAGVWFVRFYSPELFASCEPFLMLFFLHYVGVIVLTTRQRALQVRGVVDGSLVFGLPIVAFGLQARLVADKPFGMALSALAIAAVYVFVLMGMRRNMRTPALLDDSFIALALIFASLALPLAFDNQQWTAASWAMEGAGLVWVGLRQGRAFNRWFGLFLQFAGAGAFLWSIDAATTAQPVLNSFFLGSVIIAVAAWFTAFQYDRHRPGGALTDRLLRGVPVGWGLLWWLAGLWREVDHAIAARAQGAVYVLVAAASVVALSYLGVRLRWRAGILAALAWSPLLLVIWFVFAVLASDVPYAHAGWLAWPVAIAALWICLYLLRAASPSGLLAVAHTFALVLGVVVASWFIGDSAVRLTASTSTWTQVLAVALSLIVVAGLPRWAASNAKRVWPLLPHANNYWHGGAVVALLLLFWVLVSNLSEGSPAPLSYLPVVNPLEMAQIAGVLAIWNFTARWPQLRGADATLVRATVAAVAFVSLCGGAARSVHFYAGVPFAADAMWASAVLQSTLSLLWTTLAMAVMFIAARRGARTWWIGGAALLGLVVLKLLFVDLSGIGTVARIVSFIGVGGLMLVIGYLAPLPALPIDADPVPTPVPNTSFSSQAPLRVPSASASAGERS